VITGIILAGGYSSRAQTNKMMLLINGKPIVEHVILTMKVSCQKIIVVTGHYHDEISQAISHYTDVKIVKNQEYDSGMFSSVLCGLKEVDSDFFLVPGDYPMIQSSTYKMLKENQGLIRVPVYKGRRGHPIFIKKELIDELLNEPVESNLKVFRDRHQVEYVETKDAGILQDIDTIEDYEKMLTKKERVEIL